MESSEQSPLALVKAQLPSLIEEAGYSEIWGIDLSTTSSTTSTDIVLNKYLTAHASSPTDAAAGLLQTLKWRKSFNPAACADEAHDASKFSGLGFVTEIESESIVARDVIKPARAKTVVTWNVYGTVEDHQHTFGDVDEFLRWRVGLMERGIRMLRLGEGGEGDVKMVQVHDYLNVSFLRPNPAARAATKQTIELLAAHYPELLARKYFVNVPIVMGFMFGLVKPFVAKETVAKFQVLSYGSSLAGELGNEVPQVYGGEGEELKIQDSRGEMDTAAGVQAQTKVIDADIDSKEEVKGEQKAEAS